MLVSPPPSAAPPCALSAPFSAVPPAVAIRCCLVDPIPTNADSFVSPPPPIWHFRLRSPPCLYRPQGTSPLLWRSSCSPTGHPIPCAVPPPPSFSLLLPLSLAPPPLCLAAFPIHFCCVSLPSYPPLCRLAGSCIHLRRPLSLLPRPRPPIWPVRTKMSAIRQVWVRLTGWIQAGPHRSGRALSGFLL